MTQREKATSKAIRESQEVLRVRRKLDEAVKESLANLEWAEDLANRRRKAGVDEFGVRLMLASASNCNHRSGFGKRKCHEPVIYENFNGNWFCAKHGPKEMMWEAQMMARMQELFEEARERFFAQGLRFPQLPGLK